MSGYCEIKKIQCAAIPLEEEKEGLVDKFLKRAKTSFDEASSDYHEDSTAIQKQIDSISVNCPNCPYNSKSLAQEAQEYFKGEISNT